MQATVDLDGDGMSEQPEDAHFIYDEMGDLVLEFDDAQEVSHRYLIREREHPTFLPQQAR